jgi:hypothetical protein
LKKQDLIFEIEWGKYKLFFENIVVLNPDFIEKKDKEENNDNKIKVELSHLWGYVNWYLLVK